MKRRLILLIVIACATALCLSSPIYASPNACDIAGHNDPLLCPRDDGDEETELMDTIKNILDVVYFWVGILAVIFIVVGGITIQTSNGESEKIKRGKNTITYSAVGLVVVLAAFAITNFTIDALDGKSPTDRVATSESESDPPSSDDDRKKVKSVVTVKETKLYPGQQISLAKNYSRLRK
ncbi:hypothetical protein J5500_01420 [Candidatus Saccharibacteria bacterium]|nr:hypothetical protein [Candidatus Saccharibacteria bacterium]